MVAGLTTSTCVSIFKIQLTIISESITSFNDFKRNNVLRGGLSTDVYLRLCVVSHLHSFEVLKILPKCMLRMIQNAFLMDVDFCHWLFSL